MSDVAVWQLAATITAAVVGAAIGYGLRNREWQRDRRLVAYTEFSQAFVMVGRKAVVMYKAQPGTSQRRDAFDDFAATWERFGVSRAQIREVLAKNDTYDAAIACNNFVSNEIWSRFWDDPQTVEVPEELATHLQWSGLALEFGFLAAASKELGPRLFARRKARHLDTTAHKLSAALGAGS